MNPGIRLTVWPGRGWHFASISCSEAPVPSIRAVREPRRIVKPLNQPYRILVGSSGDSSSLGAIRIAHILARRRSAIVHSLAVVEPLPHRRPAVLDLAPPALLDEDTRRAALEMLRGQLATVRGTRDWTIRATMGWPVERIIDAAARWPASLVIVGMGDHGVMDRLIGSETALRITKGSTVPVLVVPETADSLPSRAVAAIDFTESSIAAAMVAATLLGANGTLTLIHASPLVSDEPAPGGMVDLCTAGAIEKLDSARDFIHGKTRRQIRSEILHGEVVPTLLEFATDTDCDLIALGGHDDNVFTRMMLGSVRAKILRQANCAVLVAPPRTM